MGRVPFFTTGWASHSPNDRQSRYWAFMLQEVNLDEVEDLVNTPSNASLYKFSRCWTMGNNNAILLFQRDGDQRSSLLAKIPLPYENELTAGHFDPTQNQKRTNSFSSEWTSTVVLHSLGLECPTIISLYQLKAGVPCLIMTYGAGHLIKYLFHSGQDAADESTRSEVFTRQLIGLGALARQSRRLALHTSTIAGLVHINAAGSLTACNDVQRDDCSDITGAQRVQTYYKDLIKITERFLKNNSGAITTYRDVLISTLWRLFDSQDREDVFYLGRLDHGGHNTLLLADPDAAYFIDTELEFAPLGVIAQVPQAVGLSICGYKHLPPTPICATDRDDFLTKYKCILASEEMAEFGLEDDFNASPPEEVAAGRLLAAAAYSPSTLLVRGCHIIWHGDSTQATGWLDQIYSIQPLLHPPEKLCGSILSIFPALSSITSETLSSNSMQDEASTPCELGGDYILCGNSARQSMIVADGVADGLS